MKEDNIETGENGNKDPYQIEDFKSSDDCRDDYTNLEMIDYNRDYTGWTIICTAVSYYYSWD